MSIHLKILHPEFSNKYSKIKLFKNFSAIYLFCVDIFFFSVIFEKAFSVGDMQELFINTNIFKLTGKN